MIQIGKLSGYIFSVAIQVPPCRDLAASKSYSSTLNLMFFLEPVFSESEVISMIAKKEKRENVIAKIHESAAVRIATLATDSAKKNGVIGTAVLAANH